MEFDYLDIMKGKTTEDLIELISLTFKKKSGIEVTRGLSNYGLSAAGLELKKRNLTDLEITKLNEITNNTFKDLGEENKQELELNHENFKRPTGLNKNLKIIGGVIVLILLYILGSNLSNGIEGTYKSEFPKCTLELQKNGNVIISPIYGDNQTPSCVTDGKWEKTKSDELKIEVVNNPNCNTNSFSGQWKVENCKTIENTSTKCLSFGGMKFVKK